MKKIFAIITIVSLAACGESSTSTIISADSATINNKIDKTTDKMNGMADSTKAKMDSLVNKSDSTVKMMADSSKMK